MSIIIFVIILGILIFVHELGHFSLAKQAGIRVDEFAIGFPPKIFGKKVGETEYKLNLVPFGGYVAIFGENPTEDSEHGPDAARSMTQQPKITQVAVLLAGIVFNFIFAWLLLSIGGMIGVPHSVESIPHNARILSQDLYVTEVRPESPADQVGIRPGDTIYWVEGIDVNTSREAIALIEEQGTEPFSFKVRRGDDLLDFRVTAVDGVIDGKPAIGVALQDLAVIQYPFIHSVWYGLEQMIDMTNNIVIALGGLIGDAFRGHGDIQSLIGPVGLVGVVGDAAQIGFVYVLTLTAFISVNLAIINLIPFPALDGGRVLFLIIESIKGSPIKPKIANWVNAIGFMLLIGLMLLVTYYDIARLF